MLEHASFLRVSGLKVYYLMELARTLNVQHVTKSLAHNLIFLSRTSVYLKIYDFNTQMFFLMLELKKKLREDVRYCNFI